MAHDVRGIANFVLDYATEKGVGVSNLSLNKIVYFLHVAYLHEYGTPLISAKIEAWDHGPVFRELYHQFKSSGREDIVGKARKLDAFSGEYREAEYDLENDEAVFLAKQCDSLIRLSAGRLVGLSHVQDGAWHQARYKNGRINPGVEITDDLILSADPHLLRH